MPCMGKYRWCIVCNDDKCSSNIFYISWFSFTYCCLWTLWLFHYLHKKWPTYAVTKQIIKTFCLVIWLQCIAYRSAIVLVCTWLARQCYQKQIYILQIIRYAKSSVPIIFRFYFTNVSLNAFLFLSNCNLSCSVLPNRDFEFIDQNIAFLKHEMWAYLK